MAKTLFHMMVALLCISCGVSYSDVCNSPQYLEIGTEGTIQCYFPSDFLSVHWYNTTDFNNEEPVLNYRDSEKSGKGFTSGEFDIHPNGSLIINNVTLQHGNSFGATLFLSRTKIPDTWVIEVQVIKRPHHHFPLINGTPAIGEAVFLTEIEHITKLTCLVEHSRPLIPLEWKIRAGGRDKPITYTNSSDVKYSLYSSTASVEYSFQGQDYLAILACRALDDPLTLLKRDESLLVVQNKNMDITNAPQKHSPVEKGTSLYLECSIDVETAVWKKRDSKSTYHDVAVFVKDVIINVFMESVTVNNNGSLTIPDVKIHHDGLYVCIHEGGEEIKVHNVTVIVLPTPSYPVVERCNHDKYCVLEGKNDGELLCRVNSILPVIRLEWRAYDSPEMITFSNQTITIEENGDLYDIYLRANYQIQSEFSNKQITLECFATGENSTYFDLNTKIDLFLTDLLIEGRKVVTFSSISVAVVLVIAVIFIIIFYCVVKRARARKARKRGKRTQYAMELGETTSHERDLLIGTNNKEQFIEQLKTTYDDQCNSIQPVPYLKDKRYRVNDVFVDGSLKMKTSNSLDRNSMSESRITYRDIFDDSPEKGTRYIIEGQPGYGKTIFTLQLAYEWCKNIKKSPLRKFKLLILLRLREVSSGLSFFETIKQLLLPIDTSLDVSEINNIIYQSSSTLIVLDGYDEFVDIRTKSDINDIIARKMLQKATVILTTRSNKLPEAYPAQVNRIELTGFDKMSQQNYMRKILGIDDGAVQRTIEDCLNNPILDDIFKVPQCFAVFTALIKQGDIHDGLSSVELFRYAIASFHYHFLNKGKIDENTILEKVTYELENKELTLLAFDSLCECETYKYWKRKSLSERLGEECLEYFIKVGILIEDDIAASLDESDSGFIGKGQRVRFSHNLFAEWYAAQYVANSISSSTRTETYQNKDNFLYSLDPYNLEYLFRFACGLNERAAEIIIGYLNEVRNEKKLAILCSLEQSGNVANFRKIITDLCKEVIQVDSLDTKLMQRATLQLLTIAAKSKIPILSLSLDECLQYIDHDKGEIYITYDLRMPNLDTLQKLTINDKRRRFSEDEVSGILKFSSRCSKLECLRFENCLLPQRLKDPSLKSLNVLWCATGTWYKLDNVLGTWKTKDFEKTMTQRGYDNEVSFCEQFLD
ncbi:uncharacterized protein [Apostichopus japonicus]|uniref:uncharacterized protein isoform X2 n=1 Tax=Stichopus japonicus TaxID=307972 RepID=UPI003AB187F1